MSGVLVIAEQRRGELRPVSLELIGAAQALRSGAGDTVAVAVLAPSPDSFVDALKVAGVDEIVAVKVGAAEFDPDTFEAAVGALIAERKPDIVLVAHSVDSFGYAAALAARSGLGFATDVFKVERIDGALVAYSHDTPIGFELCAQAGGSCRYAEARIRNAQVSLAVPTGTAPRRVRYCWADSPVCTLFDRSGLPAGPFELQIGP